MKKRRISRHSLKDLPRDRSDWRRVGRLTDAAIDRTITEDLDVAPRLGADFFANASVMMPDSWKERVTMRLDRDVLDHFRGSGRGYQTRINAVLKAYVHLSKGLPKAKRRPRAA